MGHQPAQQPTADEKRHAALLGELTEVKHHLMELTRSIHQVTPRLPSQTVTTINNANPLRVDRQGYRYLRLFSAASATITANTALGPVSLALNVGWNNLDLPEDTTLIASPSVNVLIQRTDFVPVA